MAFLNADRKFERFEDVTPKILKDEGVKLLLCDLDNTLRLHSEKEPADELRRWIKDCKKAGVKIVIISNNGRKKMMLEFCEPIDVPCIWWAWKPRTKKIVQAIAENQAKPRETVMLGDKWTTDVLGARLAGIRAWKVEHRKYIV